MQPSRRMSSQTTRSQQPTRSKTWTSSSRTTKKEGQRMAEEYRKLTREELDELAGEPLPDRAAMALVNANIALPINAAVAANVLSDGAIAYADATQETPIDQSS